LPDRLSATGKLVVGLLAALVMASLIPSHTYEALAWDPTTDDLAGTDSSTNSSVSNALRRFDIAGQTANLLNVYKGTFQKATTTGDQTISGVGFTPKAVIFWWTRQTAFGELAGIHIGYGFSTGTGFNRGVAFASDDAAATSNAGRMRSETYSIIILSAGTPTLVARASVTAFTSDGFTLNWQTNEARADYIHFVALGGADITNARAGTFTLLTGTGSQSVTGVGFQPEFLMFLWTFTEAVDTGTTGGMVGMGFATSSTSRGALAAVSRDGRLTMTTYQQQRTDSCILLLTAAGAQDAIADFVSMGSDGFTVTKSDAPAANTPIFYLAMAGGQYAVSNFQSPTSTGTQDITTAGFQPKLVLLATQGRATATAIGATSEIALGGATSSTARGCTWFEDPNGLADSDNEQETLNTKVIQWRDRTAANTFTLRGSADFSQFLSNGFQLSWSNVETAGREIIYVAFADVGVVRGMQKGEDSDSIALSIKLVKTAGANGFSVAGMVANDQYDINFTIGGQDFCMMFIASGASAGTMKIFSKPTGTSTWYSGESFSQSGIVSETTYTVGNLGFNLKSATPTVFGHVRLIAKKSYLAGLGASGTEVTNILSATFASGTGNPGSGGATPNDRCPSSGTVSWTLSGDIPEFPLGPLVSAVPIAAIYLYLRRRANSHLSEGKKPVAQHTI